MSAENRHAVRQAIEDAEDGICVGWALIAEIVGPDGTRYLAHRAGDANDECPMTWQVSGWMLAGLDDARSQGSQDTHELDDE